MTIQARTWFPLLLASTALALPNAASAGPFGFTDQEISQYLIIGTGNNQTGDAINVQGTELGADQIFVSNPDPNLADVFDAPGKQRWNSVTNTTYSPPLPPSAPVFEGIDYSGQMAITSRTGGLTLDDTSVYASGFAVRCASPSGTGTGECRDNLQSGQDSHWITPTLVDQGDIGTGVGVVGDFNHGPLIAELENAWTFIDQLDPKVDLVINSTFLSTMEDFKDGSASWNIDDIDNNGINDGLAVIDIVLDGDWSLDNFDWILNGDGSTCAIFRIRGNTNMLMSNSSIALGPGGIGGGSADDPVTSLCALFVQYEEPVNNTDAVFNFNNVILNGVAFWDLNAFRNGDYDDSVNTELNIQNGQGCSQFISSSVTFTSSVRWNHCSVATTTVPEPGSLLLLGIALAGLGFSRRKRAAKG